MNTILDRIEQAAGVPGLVSILSERLPATDLQSLLLEVYRRRAGRRAPADILTDYGANRFAPPAPVDPRRLLEWERIALAALPPEFQPLALSPVCPLGAASVLAGIDQNWAVATARNTEVVSDSTNVLALECALRRRERLRARPRSAEPVHLAANHRLLRAQHFTGPGQHSHFSAFSLCTAGRDEGGLRFELAALALHLRVYLQALRAFLGAGLPLRATVSDFAPDPWRAAAAAAALAPLQAEIPAAAVVFDDSRQPGRGYYLGLCFKIHAAAPDGRWLEIGDGGLVDWTQKLLSDSKERLLVGGLGSDRLCLEFDSARAA